MNTGVNYPALAVLVGLFVLVTIMGFWASNWRRGEHLASLDECVGTLQSTDFRQAFDHMGKTGRLDLNQVPLRDH